MKRFMLFLPLLPLSCVVQESACEYDGPDANINSTYHAVPILAKTKDTLTIERAQSAIQRSPFHLLRSFTEKKDDIYTINISEKDLEQLHISYSVYEDYRRLLTELNEKTQ